MTPSQQAIAIMAKAIHDQRCGPEVNHRTPRRYFRCISYYEDHAELALDALLDEPALLCQLAGGDVVDQVWAEES